MVVLTEGRAARRFTALTAILPFPFIGPFIVATPPLYPHVWLLSNIYPDCCMLFGANRSNLDIES